MRNCLKQFFPGEYKEGEANQKYLFFDFAKFVQVRVISRAVQHIYSSLTGCKVLNLVYKGVPFVNGRHTKSKMVYKRVRGLTTERSLAVKKTLLSDPPSENREEYQNSMYVASLQRRPFLGFVARCGSYEPLRTSAWEASTWWVEESSEKYNFIEFTSRDRNYDAI